MTVIDYELTQSLVICSNHRGRAYQTELYLYPCGSGHESETLGGKGGGSRLRQTQDPDPKVSQERKGRRTQPSLPACLHPYSANTRSSPNVSSVLVRLRKRRAEITSKRSTSTPSKHKTLNQCWFNVGPPSATLNQH